MNTFWRRKSVPDNYLCSQINVLLIFVGIIYDGLHSTQEIPFGHDFCIINVLPCRLANDYVQTCRDDKSNKVIIHGKRCKVCPNLFVFPGMKKITNLSDHSYFQYDNKKTKNKKNICNFQELQILSAKKNPKFKSITMLMPVFYIKLLISFTHIYANHQKP